LVVLLYCCIVAFFKKEMSSLYQTVMKDYPVHFNNRPDHMQLTIMLQRLHSEGQLATWKDFAEAMSQYVAEKNMNVYKSSTWAVCQEFLGNLNKSDYDYAQSRGGIWSHEAGGKDVGQTIVSVRQILTRLRRDYPI
jgi:hypothetical protein